MIFVLCGIHTKISIRVKPDACDKLLSLWFACIKQTISINHNIL